MQTLNQEELKRMAAHTGWPSVSIYLPTHRRTTENEADHIRLRNLIDAARTSLSGRGLRDPEVTALLAGASAMLSDPDTWTGGFEGLAILAEPNGTRSFRFDQAVPELALVGDRFYLRPLYVAMRPERRFWALALDRNGTRLFRNGGDSIDEVPLPPGTPSSLADELKYDVPEESLQFESTAGSPGAGPGGREFLQYHGQGGEKDADKVNLIRFVHDLQNGVTATIGAENSEPLVLLGVDYIIAMYREANAYRGLVDAQVDGATDYLSPSDVQAKALEALAPSYAAELEADLAALGDRSGTARSSSDPAEILTAAASGRVEAIMFDDGQGPWGTFDRDSFRVDRTCDAQPRYLTESMTVPEDVSPAECGWDLVDLAAAETVAHAGRVRAFGGENPPVSGVAAIFRY